MFPHTTMKIAYVYDAVYPYVKGGVEKRIRELSVRLAERGHEVHIYGMKFWEGPEVIEQDGVMLHGVCAPRALYTDERRSIVQAMWFGWKVLGSLMESDAEVIDCQNFPYFPCFSAKIAATAKRVPLVITWHEVWGEYWYEYLGWKGVFGKAVESLAAHLTDHAIAISALTGRQLAAIAGGRRGVHIPIGIECAHIQQILPSGTCSDVIFAGRLIREKNVDVLVRAICVARQEYPAIRCEIIGDGPERTSLEALASELGLEEAVQFSGFAPDYDDLIAAMKSSKVFVHPSSREGFGIIAIEAMACGLPVITVACPRNAVQELVDEETGAVCDLSAEDIAAQILRFLSGEENGLSRISEVAQRHDWEAIVDTMENYYATLV
jgi:glycosyltransferase involved in cell wall biosynthesis